MAKKRAARVTEPEGPEPEQEEPEKPTGLVEVKVKEFRGSPVLHGNVFLSTGKLKHPATTVIPASEMTDGLREILEVVRTVDEPASDADLMG